MTIEVDVDALRKDLMDYFGTAMQYNPVAVVELTKVQRAGEEELIHIALSNNFDLNNYKKEEQSFRM